MGFIWLGACVGVLLVFPFILWDYWGSPPYWEECPTCKRHKNSPRCWCTTKT